MYFNKEELEELRLKGEQQAKEIEEKNKGFKYESEAGIQVTCNHCNNDRFDKGQVLLNSRILTFLELDWLNQSATTLVCKRCGYIHWFGKEVKRIFT
jgi:predicted nucleic-acid-binding Zn-ribbon protein